jgi:hypothetical protein
MKLLREQFDCEMLIEAKENGPKSYYIKGPFMQAEVKNRNGRIYPKNVIESQVKAYQKLIEDRRSIGELSHPATPSINPERVSHLITDLNMDGNMVYGRAKIMDTPMGKIAKALMDENVKLGVSSRGLGSLKESAGTKIVQPDFQLSTIDIVSEPSGPDCFVENLMEGVDWIVNPVTGQWIAQAQNRVQEIIIETKNDREERNKKFISLFEDFLKTVSKN